MSDLLENPRAGRVKAVAALAKKDVRAETGLFLLEGPQAVREALEYAPELLRELYVTPTAAARYGLDDAPVDTWFVTEQVLDAMADTVTPQGVVAVCQQFPTSVKDVFPDRAAAAADREARDASDEQAALPGLVAILEEVRDPGNAGTIIRAADAAGADAVVLTGRSVDPYNPKVVRSTTGSLFHVPVSVGVTLADTIERAKALGYTVLAADVSGDDLPVVRAEGMLDGPTAWVFGNEARGLTGDDLALVDRAVKVPIYGQAESMNLATAASVCLYESAFALRS
ncbi:TrmH family RNA methyltransferase [Curtobacterium flaccumfaciens]|uniref:TrmH family RNA methyltransferase n=1 Tax=Curtobacterium flaccumfaciens TaxID=2035 RepID=UPI000FFF4C4D|nr:RNA methyltransferase [Curtobacterium flaccumfaciens]MCS0647559.1 RNA methyltransferase [Curtobacterium flaccumfaciens pv. flaccumfaciens]MCS6525154.1 RNA methyltransferase [Curtobacterium flaccumfaciens pv. flaccumfaciens]MCS6530300.1 RNA methyltransferase [Curtobacterium flaccumfaciens pv. flaccumfaciens]NUU10247.1 RNA methyltransferase [Curtobacterium flaccumfaciens]RXF85180.1 RNA methyltransferase [Curtobacterium flaccumfaciens pv. flaccumfaciens]